MRNFNKRNEIFNRDDKEKAIQSEFAEWDYIMEMKVVRRLHTCTYDIVRRKNNVYIYMSGLKENARVHYFILNPKVIERMRILIYEICAPNCEIIDYINRSISFVSYKYIWDVIAKTYPKLHKKIIRHMSKCSRLQDMVAEYIKRAKNVFWDEYEYKVLLDIQYYRMMTKEVKNIVERYLVDFFYYDKNQYIGNC